ncbi:MAG: hypothetical protein CO060_00140 [Candidatus Yonathbacteria bacterium CG_4_9_14_0_2_um_filter_43_16]|uniref:Uncharacterized protein n=1 Tax=Candidatus Nomurabacteria bacterium CG2_30_43_9 TaxID=1805283 RepID=A0A1J5G1L6_9BACT|nr:MAG: hypothetical protein AUK15_00720 [Candidatus Nomurabacteria bacterium CG2_30_43_9]PJC22587.1 MAG: hypothetical protein CO060_00140 [Candidatus Yonathbacteria bacterium CG_4_9_14_0_2_um_filter_43_16]
METLKKDWFRGGIILVVVIFAVSVLWMLYQSMVAIPKQKIAGEQKQFEYNVENLKQCNSEAEQRYINGWTNDCAELKKEARCALPLYMSEKWDKMVVEDKNRCAELYKN